MTKGCVTAASMPASAPLLFVCFGLTGLFMHAAFLLARRQHQRSGHQPSRSQYLPRHTGYPWPTPGRHYHHPDGDVYYYDSDAEDSAGEEEECTHYPPHTPVHTHYPLRTPSHSSSSRSRAQAGYGEAPQPLRQSAEAWTHPGSRQPQPEPVYPPGACCPQHAHLQQQQHMVRGQAPPMRTRQQAQAAPVSTPLQPGHKLFRHIPVSSAQQVPAPAAQQVQQQAPRAPVQPVRPSRQLSQAEAALVIQSWWRMRRLARQQPALRALMDAHAQLRQVASKFEAYRAGTSSGSNSSSEAASLPRLQAERTGFITHKQYLELNELAMRVLLQLDCTPCGVPELRAVRKRLAGSAMSLLDSLQAAFSATVTASMEVPDSLVQEALGHMSSKAGAAAASSQHQQQQHNMAQLKAGPQQQQQKLVALQSEQVPASGGAVACDPVAAPPSAPVEGLTAAPAVRVVLRVAGQCCEAATQTD